MTRIRAILDARGNPVASPAPRASVPSVRARYDMATPSQEDRRHWSLVDGMSARAANSKEVRFRLRTRARYEAANNSYAAGIVSTLANDTIGTGARLQMLTPDPELNATIERAFMAWSNAAGLPEKLRTMRRSLAVDGEGFALVVTNDRLPGPVKLDLKLIEADQVSSPFLNPIDPLQVDGIHYDTDGNPVQYDILKHHPGDTYQLGLIADAIDAARMLHWFRADRPGQCRGIPEITPALPLFAQLRRYTLAVLAAAETAADFAAVLYSELPPDADTPDATPFETLDIERRMMTTLPAGWKMGQFKAEQPTTSYQGFKHELLNEIARCLNMPFNIAAGNSSSYNYSSGRLDHQTYYKALAVDQAHLVRVILDPVLAAWIEEAALAGLIPPGLADWPHQWFFDGHEHVDPKSEAQAQEIRLTTHTTTLADEYARRGQDWETQLRQRAREIQLMNELGIPLLAPKQAPVPPEQPSDGNPDRPDPTRDNGPDDEPTPEEVD